MTRRLTREDRELWERLRQTVKPLRATTREAAIEERAPTPKSTTLAPGRDGPPPLARRRTQPDLAPLEERTRRRLARRLTEVEAHIDLHGMRQERAFAKLIAFLRRAQSDGQRVVLVITGKGREGGAESGGRGVLKQSVPLWLERPEFRALVVGFSEAGRRHGGSGALYVQIRRRGGSGR